jgi:ubiquinone/menaquinone biosynthesis C-methylase UbiE
MSSPKQIERFGKSDKKFYDQELHYFDDNDLDAFKAHTRTVRKYIDVIQPHLVALAKSKGRPLDVIELGAGTCTASLCLRNVMPTGRHVCVDISGSRMEALISKTASLLGADAGGIELVEADFTYELPFEDQSFDVVLFDGALHHSRNIWTTLEESRRVLRPGGGVAALREAMLGLVTYRYAMKRLLASPEVQAGVAENIYLREQYDYYFRATGFDPSFLAVYSGWRWKLLAPLNGIVMSKWAVWAPLNSSKKK